MPLDACPFCRDLFESGEATHCPTCGIALADATKLPPSPTLRHETDEWDEDLGPEHDKLPLLHLGRSRGIVLALAMTGTVLFMLPWIDMALPYTARLSGWDLSRRMGWSWAALAAWVVLIPTIASRRSIFAMRGARVAAAFLSAMPALTGAILLALPPSSALVPVRLTFDWPIYASIAVSLLAVAASVTLGGSLDVMVAKKGSSAGETLH